MKSKIIADVLRSVKCRIKEEDCKSTNPTGETSGSLRETMNKRMIAKDGEEVKALCQGGESLSQDVKATVRNPVTGLRGWLLLVLTIRRWTGGISGGGPGT